MIADEGGGSRGRRGRGGIFFLFAEEKERRKMRVRAEGKEGARCLREVKGDLEGKEKPEGGEERCTIFTMTLWAHLMYIISLSFS